MSAVSDLFLLFLFYSLLGWLWEELLYVVRDHHVVNRGFLLGPLCPIYGSGAILCLMLMYGRLTNPFLIFIVGTAVCTLLEYITHYLLEKCFHTMWWDYSKVRFNLGGRICLGCSLAFGLCITALLCLVQPLMDQLLLFISPPFKRALCFLLYSLLVVDLTLSLNALLDLNRRLKLLQEELTAQLQKNVDQSAQKQQFLAEQLEIKIAQLGKHRFFHSLPEFNSKRYRDAIRSIKEHMKKN